MTTLVIQPQVFYDAATGLHDAAANLYSEVDGRWSALAAGDHMAGTYDEATKWAASYDQRAYEALSLVSAVARAMDSYAGVLRGLGHNHATAEYNATHGDAGTPPAAPPAPTPAVYSCRAPLPAAGGPQNGLDDALKLAEKVGIIVPNGDTGKLGAIADAWTGMQTLPAVANLPAEMDRIIGLFADIQSPECEFIESDLRQLKASAEAVPSVFGALATACRDHSTQLAALRKELEQQLRDLGEELAKELAITAAIGIATSLVTFGIGAAVASARAVEIAARFARPIRAIIDVWKGRNKIQDGIKIEQDLQAHYKELHSISKLGDDVKAAGKTADGAPVNPASLLNDIDKKALWEYTGKGGSEPLNFGLRHGGLNRAQQLQVDDINAALSKLPNHEGVVTRRVDISPEDLARYEKGAKVTEEGFTSTSKSPDAAFDRPVEMQIFSKTGKDISSMAHKPEEQEVLFRSGTPFNVVDRFTDPDTGRTIIRMIEQ
ncbi:ADP-ribosyltransferase [Nocardia wallacei]|uniref:ADP-ribosyltransferase n=1 Tax=Nocardia wallacei TaxID=480035 RepID=UPI00245475AA|nr:ADP-ribosyltransferase [Nocardia wallacei]